MSIERLRWQCRRGLLELDFVFERYLNERFEMADKKEQILFEELLQSQDPELQLWIFNGHPHPQPRFQSLIDRIRGI